MRSGKRRLRRSLELGFPALGAAFIMFAAAAAESVVSRIGLAAIGTTLLLVSSFDLQQALLPSDRRFLRLRAEVEGFIQAIRRLTAAGIAAAEQPERLAEFHAASAELPALASRIEGVAAESFGLPPRAPAGAPAAERS
jgi:hypothetical protein